MFVETVEDKNKVKSENSTHFFKTVEQRVQADEEETKNNSNSSVKVSGHPQRVVVSKQRLNSKSSPLPERNSRVILKKEVVLKKAAMSEKEAIPFPMTSTAEKATSQRTGRKAPIQKSKQESNLPQLARLSFKSESQHKECRVLTFRSNTHPSSNRADAHASNQPSARSEQSTSISVGQHCRVQKSKSSAPIINHLEFIVSKIDKLHPKLRVSPLSTLARPWCGDKAKSPRQSQEQLSDSSVPATGVHFSRPPWNSSTLPPPVSRRSVSNTTRGRASKKAPAASQDEDKRGAAHSDAVQDEQCRTAAPPNGGLKVNGGPPLSAMAESDGKSKAVPSVNSGKKSDRNLELLPLQEPEEITLNSEPDLNLNLVIPTESVRPEYTQQESSVSETVSEHTSNPKSKSTASVACSEQKILGADGSGQAQLESESQSACGGYAVHDNEFEVYVDECKEDLREGVAVPGQGPSPLTGGDGKRKCSVADSVKTDDSDQHVASDEFGDTDLQGSCSPEVMSRPVSTLEDVITPTRGGGRDSTGLIHDDDNQESLIQDRFSQNEVGIGATPVSEASVGSDAAEYHPDFDLDIESGTQTKQSLLNKEPSLDDLVASEVCASGALENLTQDQQTSCKASIAGVNQNSTYSHDLDLKDSEMPQVMMDDNLHMISSVSVADDKNKVNHESQEMPKTKESSSLAQSQESALQKQDDRSSFEDDQAETRNVASFEADCPDKESQLQNRDNSGLGSHDRQVGSVTGSGQAEEEFKRSCGESGQDEKNAIRQQHILLPWSQVANEESREDLERTDCINKSTASKGPREAQLDEQLNKPLDVNCSPDGNAETSANLVDQRTLVTDSISKNLVLSSTDDTGPGGVNLLIASEIVDQNEINKDSVEAGVEATDYQPDFDQYEDESSTDFNLSESHGAHCKQIESHQDVENKDVYDKNVTLIPDSVADICDTTTNIDYGNTTVQVNEDPASSEHHDTADIEEIEKETNGVGNKTATQTAEMPQTTMDKCESFGRLNCSCDPVSILSKNRNEIFNTDDSANVGSEQCNMHEFPEPEGCDQGKDFADLQVSNAVDTSQHLQDSNPACKVEDKEKASSCPKQNSNPEESALIHPESIDVLTSCQSQAYDDGEALKNSISNLDLPEDKDGMNFTHDRIQNVQEFKDRVYSELEIFKDSSRKFDSETMKTTFDDDLLASKQAPSNQAVNDLVSEPTGCSANDSQEHSIKTGDVSEFNSEKNAFNNANIFLDDRKEPDIDSHIDYLAQSEFVSPDLLSDTKIDSSCAILTEDTGDCKASKVCIDSALKSFPPRFESESDENVKSIDETCFQVKDRAQDFSTKVNFENSLTDAAKSTALDDSDLVLKDGLAMNPNQDNIGEGKAPFEQQDDKNYKTDGLEEYAADFEIDYFSPNEAITANDPCKQETDILPATKPSADYDSSLNDENLLQPVQYEESWEVDDVDELGCEEQPLEFEAVPSLQHHEPLL